MKPIKVTRPPYASPDKIEVWDAPNIRKIFSEDGLIVQLLNQLEEMESDRDNWKASYQKAANVCLDEMTKLDQAMRLK